MINVFFYFHPLDEHKKSVRIHPSGKSIWCADHMMLIEGALCPLKLPPRLTQAAQGFHP